jgi:hypothetical protein
MDFDPASTANSPQVALYAMQSQQADRSAAAAPPFSPRLVARANTSVRQRPTTYHDLPPEILQQVADHMLPDDLVNLSTVDRRTCNALQERRLSALYCQRATHFRTEELPQAQQLLADIERIQDPMLRAKPLQVLGRQVDCKSEMFVPLFEAAGRVPKQGLQIQKDMILSLSFSAPLLYNFVYADAERRGPEQGSTWAAVASLMGGLYLSYTSFNSQKFESEFQNFLNRLPTLATADQAELIAALADTLTSVRAFEASALLYKTLFEWVQRLPASHRGAPIRNLAWGISLLPEAQRPAHYANLRHWTLSLPDHQLSSALDGLLWGGVMALPPEQHAYELSLLEPMMQRVLPEQRASVARGLLATKAYGLNETLLRQIYQHALRLLDNCNERDKRDTFFGEFSPFYSCFIDQYLQEINAFVEGNQPGHRILDILLEQRRIEADSLLGLAPADWIPTD